MSKLIIGKTDTPVLLAKININVPSRTFRNYRLFKTQLASRAYCENDNTIRYIMSYYEYYLTQDSRLSAKQEQI